MVASSPPYRLVASVASEAMGIGKSSDVLTVLGGKASCRRKFVLNVHLLDENGNLASNKDLTIVASVAYAHDHCPVVRDDKPYLAEPPLFTTFNGVEFPASERPTRMVSGRACFKLAISLLSSKCDNRLFCICFSPQFPPDTAPICAPCYSKPIRSISRKRTQSTQLTIPLPGPFENASSPSPVSPGGSNSNASPRQSESCVDTPPVSPPPAPPTRPFRPYASVGAFSDLQLGIGTRTAENSNNAAANKLSEVSLEEEEKSLQYIEVSLQEVNRELQRRKEELRSKRRKMLEEDARTHSIIFQSSSWIESLSGRFSL